LRILVTGVTGMVGRTVVERLLANAHEVVGAVRNPGAASAWPEVRQVRLDLRADPVIDPQCLAGIDCIIHLAGRVHVMTASPADRQAFHQENTVATASLARLGLERGVHRFVFASTVKVNGEGTRQKPFGPADAPMPSDDYARSKLGAEREVLELTGSSRMQAAIVRPTLVYGPHVRGNFRALMRIVERGIPLPLKGIANLRSLVNVWNLAEFIEALATAPLPDSRVWMVSDGEDVSTPELITKLAVAFSRRPHLFSVPLWMLETMASVSGRKAALARLTDSLQVDISSSLASLPWRPRVALDEGLRRTVAWYLAQSRRV
jgi:UDP-glucose 4-epimerase